MINWQDHGDYINFAMKSYIIKAKKFAYKIVKDSKFP